MVVKQKCTSHDIDLRKYAGNEVSIGEDIPELSISDLDVGQNLIKGNKSKGKIMWIKTMP